MLHARKDITGKVQYAELAKLLGSDQTSRTVRYVLSTASSDRVSDTIAADGWDLKNYLKNPVLLWGHDKKLPPIGKAISIGVVGQQLEGVYEFASADVSPFADTIYKLVIGGFCPAGSVGFMPTEWSYDEGRGGYNFLKQELLEFSAVTVPANPEALMVAREIMSSVDVSEQLHPGAFKELRAALSAQKAAPAAPTPARYAARARSTAAAVRLAGI